jgi:hypothetical protein
MTLEAPRLIMTSSNATTPAAVVADLVFSGHLKRFGVTYAIGLYNVANAYYTYPVAATYASLVAPQNGRTFLADLKVTYP